MRKCVHGPSEHRARRGKRIDIVFRAQWLEAVLSDSLSRVDLRNPKDRPDKAGGTLYACRHAMLISRKCLPHITTAFVATSLGFLPASSVFAAAAQIVVSPYVERIPPSSRHDLETDPLAIGIEDCENNVVTRLSVNLPQQGTLEVYAGDSSDPCNDEDQRDEYECWPILNVYADETQAVKIDVPAQDLALGSCDKSLDQDVTVFIALMDDGELVGQGEWSTRVDLVGPNAPDNVTAGIGESRLELEWDTPSGESVAGFRFYCAVPGTTPTDTGAAGAGADDSTRTNSAALISKANGGAGGGGGTSSTGGGVNTGGAGSTDDAETGGTANGTGGGASAGASGAVESTTTNSSSSCYSADLVAGERPGKGAWACGSQSSGTATSGSTKKLQNNQAYAVAVASVDDLGNVSVLSAPACETPQELTDFYEAYSAASGRGGGGFCSISTIHREPAVAVGLGAALLGLLARRPRRGSRRA